MGLGRPRQDSPHRVVARLVPIGTVWVVVDDTLAHKRGAHVALGGFSLDAVVSSKRRKVLRFGVNWIVVDLAVHLPFRPDRTFCLPVLRRTYRKKGTPGHRTRTALAAELARSVALCLPDRDCWLMGDGAYVNAAMLHDPYVWCERSVERAHPMAWYVQTLTVLWYATAGHAGQPLSLAFRTLRQVVVSRRGNDLVRRYLWMAALSVVRFNPAVRALYARVVAKHPNRKAVAVGHAMRKLLHLAFAVWKTRRPFDAAHFPWDAPTSVDPTDSDALFLPKQT